MPTADLEVRLRSIPGAARIDQQADGLWVEGPAVDVEAMAETMNGLGIRLGTITATPLAEFGETVVIYHFTTETSVINVKTATRNGRLSSIATRIRAARWAEREIKDLFAVEFAGHPDPRPLIRPPGFEDGFFRAAMNAQARIK